MNFKIAIQKGVVDQDWKNLTFAIILELSSIIKDISIVVLQYFPVVDITKPYFIQKNFRNTSANSHDFKFIMANRQNIFKNFLY